MFPFAVKSYPRLDRFLHLNGVARVPGSARALSNAMHPGFSISLALLHASTAWAWSAPTLAPSNRAAHTSSRVSFTPTRAVAHGELGPAQTLTSWGFIHGGRAGGNKGLTRGSLAPLQLVGGRRKAGRTSPGTTWRAQAVPSSSSSLLSLQNLEGL